MNKNIKNKLRKGITVDNIRIFEYNNINEIIIAGGIMDNSEHLAEIFKALAHPIRLKIVCGLIKRNECNVSNMVEKLGVPQPTVSQYLNILKNAGIITGYKKGTQICYKVTDETTRKVIEALEVNLCE